MAKRDHLKDYRLNDEGSYEYVGAMWKWAGSGKGGFLVAVAAPAAFGAAALLALGFMPAAATGGDFLILLPYVIAMIGALMCGFSLARIAGEGDPMRDHVYRAGIERLALAAIPGMLGSALAALGCVVRILQGAGQGYLPWLACIAMAIAAACFWKLRETTLATEFEVVDGGTAGKKEDADER